MLTLTLLVTLVPGHSIPRILRSTFSPTMMVPAASVFGSTITKLLPE
jgi:hypothetical protein